MDLCCRSEFQYSDAGSGKEFDTFCEEIQNSYLHISGLGGTNDIECSFDIPRTKAPPGRTPRLELFYGGDSKTGKFAGDDLQLDNFPRFENNYTTQMITTAPSGGGLRPQVDGFATSKAIGFGSTGYRISHPLTGLTLDHDCTTPMRKFTSQQELDKKPQSRRLENGSLTGIRRNRVVPAKTRTLPRPHLKHLTTKK